MHRSLSSSTKRWTRQLRPMMLFLLNVVFVTTTVKAGGSRMASKQGTRVDGMAFVTPSNEHQTRQRRSFGVITHSTAPTGSVSVRAAGNLFMSGSDDAGDTTAAKPRLERVPEDQENVPLPFVHEKGDSSFIECYADTVAIVNGVEYTIGVPCDYSVALCYFKEAKEEDEQQQLIPIELDDELMDDVFPVAERIVADEFGDELELQRTPQTLTLVGELEDDEDDMGFEEDDELSIEDGNVDNDDDMNGEEEVEVLITFEHRDREYHLVRLLDPVLIVGKREEANNDDVDIAQVDRRVLLNLEESEKVMPVLEDLFLQFHDDPDAILP